MGGDDGVEGQSKENGSGTVVRGQIGSQRSGQRLVEFEWWSFATFWVWCGASLQFFWCASTLIILPAGFA